MIPIILFLGIALVSVALVMVRASNIARLLGFLKDAKIVQEIAMALTVLGFTMIMYTYPLLTRPPIKDTPSEVY